MFEHFRQGFGRLRNRVAGSVATSGAAATRPAQEGPHRRKDELLQNAAIGSVLLHLMALLLIPSPGASSQSTPEPRITLHTSVSELPDPAPPAESIEGAKHVPEEPENLTDPEQYQRTELPTPAAEEVAEMAIPSPGAADPEATADLDGSRVTSLLQETRDALARDQTRERWLMLEVREKIRANLAQLQQKETRITVGPGEASCLLGFFIDADGWIFDISLRPAPGIQIDAIAIRDAIAILNPLTPPPAVITPPIRLHLRVDFLE